MYENAGMNLDDLFEDLEAQFDGYLGAAKTKGQFERSHVMRVWHHKGRVTELAAPILGDDFVAGMALGANVFRLIRLDSVLKVSLIELTNTKVPTSRFVPLETADFLGRLPLPFSLRWQPFGERISGVVVVLDLLGKCLLVESVLPEDYQLLPIQAIAHLELIDVENFDTQT